MSVLAIDVSGNFEEGKGTTGLAYFSFNTIEKPTELNEIKASNFQTAEAYWSAHLDQINFYQPEFVVLEGYRLYHHKGMSASSQANSELETPQLIGCIRLFCYTHKIPLAIQSAAQVKSRWNDNVLSHLGILEKQGRSYTFNGERTNTHKRDAIRHGMHFIRYTLKKEDN